MTTAYVDTGWSLDQHSAGYSSDADTEQQGLQHEAASLLPESWDCRRATPWRANRVRLLLSTALAVMVLTLCAVPLMTTTGAVKPVQEAGIEEGEMGLYEPRDNAVPGAVGVPGVIIPNDFWAIHDLLLIGFDAYFVRPDTDGSRLAKQSALELARMLPKLHPFPPCRGRVAQVLAASAGQTPQRVVIAAAQACWDCLPGPSGAGFSASDFTTAFLPTALWLKTQTVVGSYQQGVAEDARDPFVNNPNVLGACRGSHWPRTCSYWVSLHSMAYRADALNLGTPFLHNVLNLLASGATMCGGCTIHIHVLWQTVMPGVIPRDLGELH